MKSKALLTAVLLAASNFAWAQGGISVDNFEQHYGVAPVDTSQASSFSSDESYVDLSKLGKPSSGPAYRGGPSNGPVFFDLSILGKPSNGPTYNGQS
ncbi:MAG: hypothetical protein GKR92_06160 [Gammaproteobacteria bacterium]|nr:MAG: hypothetical protein GKR92_06160 [Gammaproteobacteria bacterium]